MSNTPIILLNGPKSCGKTEAIKYMIKRGLPLKQASCKDHLHKLTMSFFNIREGLYWDLYKDRVLKETPSPHFNITLSGEELLELGYNCPYLRDSTSWDHDQRCESWSEYGITMNLSPREAMIYISEVICKPRFGSDYFGKVRASSLHEGGVYIDDSAAAFEANGEIKADELTPLIQKVGNDNILLIRITRDGFNFEGDSRRYIPDGVCGNTYDISNVDEVDFYEEVGQLVCDFIGLSWRKLK